MNIANVNYRELELVKNEVFDQFQPDPASSSVISAEHFNTDEILELRVLPDTSASLPSLFRPQRVHRIDTRRPPRRQVAGEVGDHHHQESDCGVSERIDRAHVE